MMGEEKKEEQILETKQDGKKQKTECEKKKKKRV